MMDANTTGYEKQEWRERNTRRRAGANWRTRGSGLPEDALREVREAKRLLEHLNFMIRAVNLIGVPLTRLLAEIEQRIPQKAVHQTLVWSMQRAFDVSLKTLRSRGRGVAHPRLHRLAADISGGVGGFFGLPGLLVDLPVTTLVTFRSMAEIARAEGADLDYPEARLECLGLFMLGGPSKADDSAETAYYASRAGVARSIHAVTSYCRQEAELAEATVRVLTRKAADEAGKKQAPYLVRLIQKIAEKLGKEVSVKALGQAMVGVGAVAGMGLNHLFTGHYQRLARGHFTIRRLERTYGHDAIKQAYAEAAI